MKKKIPLEALVFGFIGFTFVIFGIIKGSEVFSLNYVFGVISLLYTLHLLNNTEINSLGKRIKKLEEKE